MKNSQLTTRVGYALQGIKSAITKESSLRFQMIAFILLIGLCFFLKISFLWCALFLAMSCLVICLELVNSAVEALLDKLYPEFDRTVKYIKDCLAGAVLVASVGSVGVFVFCLISN